MKKWLESVKDDAKQRSVDELMKAVDVLEVKVPKNESEKKAIKLMLQIYEYEIQVRMWQLNEA